MNVIMSFTNILKSIFHVVHKNEIHTSHTIYNIDHWWNFISILRIPIMNKECRMICDRLDHVFIGPITSSLALHNK